MGHSAKSARGVVESGHSPSPELSRLMLVFGLPLTLPLGYLAYRVGMYEYAGAIGVALTALGPALMAPVLVAAIIESLRRRGVLYVRAEAEETDSATSAKVRDALGRRSAVNGFRSRA